MASASQGSTPAAACPRVASGGAANQAQLVAVRIAHQPGFDRVVFELGRSTAPGGFGIPTYVVEPVSSLSGASGQPVRLEGNAMLSVRFQNTSTRSPDTGAATYGGSTDMRPTTPLVRELRLVEDFERVMVWGAGLGSLVCPKVTELANPYRLVLDFASAP